MEDLARVEMESLSDLEALSDIAEVLGMAERTLYRWSSDSVGLPGKIPRHTRQDANHNQRTHLRWSDVIAYCRHHNRTAVLAQAEAHLKLAHTPDPVLSEHVASLGLSQTAPDIRHRSSQTVLDTSSEVTTPAPTPSDTSGSSPTLAETVSDSHRQTAGVPAELRRSLEELRAEMQALRAGREALAQQLREQGEELVARREESAVLREKVSQLRQRLTGEQERRREERLRMDAQLETLRGSYAQEIQRFQATLEVRQQEAADMRKTAERQQQRSDLLSWQAATNARDRDVLIGVIKELEGASAWQRLTWRPPALGMGEGATPDAPALPAVVEVESID